MRADTQQPTAAPSPDHDDGPGPRLDDDDAPGPASRLEADDTSVELAVEVFRMLADPTRVRLLVALVSSEMGVTALAERVGKPAPAVSQHLAKLRLARLVSVRRRGTQMLYRVDSEHVRHLVTDAVHHAEHAAGGVPRHHRDEQR